jgi:prepilin peptidase CpaA
MLEAIIFVVFPFCMAFAAVSDMLTMTIANRVSLLLIATFAIVAPFTGMDLATYGMHFAGGGLVLAVTFALFAMGWAVAMPNCSAQRLCGAGFRRC